MKDIISRQTVIDALNKHCDVVCQYSKKQRSVMCGACPLGTAFDVIEALPSAQPERCEDCVTFGKTRLLIPQPEIIRCKDCKKAPKCYGDVVMRSKGGGYIYCPLTYCSEAERREE